jgi:soluble lytic murein transglycosylase
MAYEYDQLGNIIGEYESDEERRRRLDAEAAQQPVKQTTTYNADGTQEVTIRGTPQALSSANPNTPTVTGPVSPDDTFRRMQQVESGNRDFDAQGRPITSPAGAMFRNQVMPATAAAPGFGIRPAQAQTPEEYNRVGEEYYQAMLKKFGGDTQKAAAAYNAGPGRVQQNMQANQGQMNVQRLPRETQGYLQKIGQAVSNIIPSAQAGTLPPNAPVAPTAMPPAAPPPSTWQGQTDEFGGMESPRAPSSYVLGTQMGNQGIRIPGLTPVGQMPAPQDQTAQAITRYQSIQDNPEELMKLGYSQDPAVPEFLRNRARGRTAELITQQREMESARQQIPTMNESDIAQALRKKTTEGSYIKAALFSMLGMNVSAEAEAAKLGIGRETFVTVNGQPAMVKMSANGTPIEGYNATTGKRLSASELVAAAQGAVIQKGANIGGQVYRDPMTNETLTKVDTAQGPIYFNKAQQRVVPRGEPVPLTAGSDVATQLQLAQMKRQQAFVGQTAEARIRAFNETNNERALAGMTPLTPAQMGLNANGELIGQTQPTVPPLQQPPGMAGQPQPQPTAPGAVAPTALPVPTQAPAVVSQPGLTPAQIQAQRKAREEIVKKAADVVADSSKIIGDITKANRAVDILDNQKTNFGAITSGILPGEQAVGKMLGTTDARNTQKVMEVIDKLNAAGAKTLGANPTDRDLAFLIGNTPNESFEPADVKEWINNTSEAIRRNIEIARKQVESGGTYAPPVPEVGAGAPELTEAQKARAEIERRKKEKR